MNITTELARFAEVIETYLPMLEEMKRILGVKQDKKLLEAVVELKQKNENYKQTISEFGKLIGVSHFGYAEKMLIQINEIPDICRAPELCRYPVGPQGDEPHQQRYARRGMAMIVADLMAEVEMMDDVKDRVKAINDFIEWKNNLSSRSEFEARTTLWIREFKDELAAYEQQKADQEMIAKLTAEEAKRRADPTHIGFE